MMITVADIGPITRAEARGLAQAETAKMVALLADLTPDEWARPTGCPDWDVRAMAGHVLGMTEGFTGLRRMATMFRAGGKRAGDRPMIDGVTEHQVAANAHLCPDELVARMAAAGPRQARWRTGRAILRRMPMKNENPDGTVETWRMGFVFEVILTRDTWMHRVDVAQATGRTLDLTPEHDGRIVADVVAEWARRHGRPFTLELTGPAGGTFTGATGGTSLTCDAIEFCRTLSGRAPGTGLLAQRVPF
ncbi:MAG: maleylpyruvate isomerase family mycothiol-dependent enzyme [Pseudonocardia sp.]|nr:maleylpyruvate isomerase family mycothiol-dependent enzyme [Pseudonocardia sp.]